MRKVFLILFGSILFLFGCSSSISEYETESLFQYDEDINYDYHFESDKTFDVKFISFDELRFSVSNINNNMGIEVNIDEGIKESVRINDIAESLKNDKSLFIDNNIKADLITMFITEENDIIIYIRIYEDNLGEIHILY